MGENYSYKEGTEDREYNMKVEGKNRFDRRETMIQFHWREFLLKGRIDFTGRNLWLKRERTQFTDQKLRFNGRKEGKKRGANVLKKILRNK